MNKETSQPLDEDDAWEPGGTLGNDARYAVPLNDPEAERSINRALGLRIRFRRWLREMIAR